MSRRTIAALLTVLAIALPVCAERLRIVYTNDLHARLERLASVGERIAGARAKGDPVLLVDAGDAWQDFRVPVYAVWGAEEVVDWMNRVGYDAMAPGNHDFYPGWAKVEALAAQATFPVVCANLKPTDATEAPFAGSRRVDVGGLNVLVVGLTALESLPVFDIPWLRPVDPVEALRREIAAAPGKPDLIVCLAHVSLDEAERMAAAVPEIDVFVTGHSHAVTPMPRVVGQTLVVQSGAFGRYVGELIVEVEDGAAHFIDNALVATTEEAATDIGRGLTHLAQIMFGTLVFCLVFAL